MDTTNLKQIKGFEEYWISDDGTVFSNYISTRKNFDGEDWQEIQPLKNHKSGYHYVGIYRKVPGQKRGERIWKRVHRLVYENWVGEIPAGMTVHHKNHNKKDNRVENLEVVTHRENLRLYWEYKNNEK